MAIKKCSHRRSLQLLCTVGGSQARLDTRTEFEISQRSLKGGEAGREMHCGAFLSSIQGPRGSVSPPPCAQQRWHLISLELRLN